MHKDLSGCAIVQNNKVLLLYKLKRKHYEFPGGKVEPGETLEQTAIRECKEEIGIPVILGDYLGYDTFVVDHQEFRGHLFLGIIDQEPSVQEAAFDHYRWIPIEKYTEYPCSPNAAKFCKKVLLGSIHMP